MSERQICPECRESRPLDYFWSVDPETGVRSQTRPCRVCNKRATRIAVDRIRETRRLYRGTK